MCLTALFWLQQQTIPEKVAMTELKEQKKSAYDAVVVVKQVLKISVVSSSKEWMNTTLTDSPPPAKGPGRQQERLNPQRLRNMRTIAPPRPGNWPGPRNLTEASCKSSAVLMLIVPKCGRASTALSWLGPNPDMGSSHSASWEWQCRNHLWAGTYYGDFQSSAQKGNLRKLLDITE